MRVLSMALALAGAWSSVRATTLRLLTTDEMILQSTAIVRAKVVGSRSAFRGPDIFTYYQLQVVESWKLSGAQQVEVAVPGGRRRAFGKLWSGLRSSTSVRNT